MAFVFIAALSAISIAAQPVEWKALQTGAEDAKP